MKIIQVEIKDNWKFQEIDFKASREISILISYEIKNLKELFFCYLKINVPLDILRESDWDYVKSNISKILYYYFEKIRNDERIKLEDKLFKCKKCNHWAYFNSNDFEERDICLLCFPKAKRNMQEVLI